MKSYLVALMVQLTTVLSWTPTWVHTPGTVLVCTGDTATLQWIYNDSFAKPRGLNVARSDLVLPLVSKTGEQDYQSHMSRVRFLPNAGVEIVRVTQEDAGKYESTVVFSDDKSLLDEATLIVYDDCPDKEAFEYLAVDTICPIQNGAEELDWQSQLRDYRNMILQVKVPESNPKVKCCLYVDEQQFDCESRDAKLPTEEMEIVNVTAIFSHEVRGNVTRSINIVNCTGQSDCKEQRKLPSIEADTQTKEPEVHTAITGKNTCDLTGVYAVIWVILVLQAVLVAIQLYDIVQGNCRKKKKTQQTPPSSSEPGVETEFNAPLDC